MRIALRAQQEIPRSHLQFSYLIPSRSGQLEPLKVLPSRISYDTLRAHDIFKGRPDLQSVFKNREQKPNAAKSAETDFSQPELLSDGSASSGAGNAAAIDILSYDVAGTPDYASILQCVFPLCTSCVCGRWAKPA